MSESNVRHMMLDDGMTGGTGTDDVMIEVTDLRKSYGNVEVIKGVDLTVHRGEVICIIGPSGAGKSTLLRCLNGLEHATSGRIVVNGHDLNDPKVNIDKVREQVGMVFQHFNLFNNMSVIDNITLAPKLVHKESEIQAREHAMRLLETVGLAEKADAMPRSLSGGQKQRGGAEREAAERSYHFAIRFFFPHLGLTLMKNSQFMRGMGRERTERYSSLKRLLIVALSERSARRNAKPFSSERLFIT